MTTRTSPPFRNRRPRGPAHGRPAVRRRPLWGGFAALTVLGVAACGAMGWTPLGSHAPGAGSVPPGGSGAGPARAPRASASPSPSPSAPPEVPSAGPGTFTAAGGESAVAGSGKVLRYRVEVEDGLEVSAADAAREVDAVLADRRGWTADGHSAFQRVPGGTADFVVRIATPGTVDRICGRYGLDTGGEVNCSVAQNVMVNLKRWLLATPVYADDVHAYRALIINHEVGHFLGHGHVSCPGPGQPAPVMMQQIKGMHGCRPNVWPYDEQGRYVTGPAV
ncbi:DUF3152 domain-containing protein [Streptomyces griseosporeus]|uniref:DUF3152 domain-containing protein n=1 Tax=Streptomyces griseosporeus TaxID=1910 RepID=UPI0037021023